MSILSQKTLKNQIIISGVGLHTGKPVELKLLPSTPNTGIDQVRIAYVLNKDSLTKAMNCLEEALKVYPGRKQ